MLIVAAGAGGAWWWNTAGVSAPQNGSQDASSRPPALFTLEQDGLRYEYHAVTGAETLWDLSAPAGQQRNLARERADELPALRDALRRKLGIQDLAELRAPHEALAEQLRALGYR